MTEEFILPIDNPSAFPFMADWRLALAVIVIVLAMCGLATVGTVLYMFRERKVIHG